KNRGAAAARNTGMDAASGDYLWWVDPDDYIAEDAVFDLLHGLGDERPDIIAFGHSEFVDNVPEKRYEHIPNMGYTTIQGMLNCIIIEEAEWGSLWRKLFRRGFLIENGIRSTEGVSSENDLDFFVNMIGVEDAQIKNDYHCCYYLRMARPGSLANSKQDAVSHFKAADRYISELEYTLSDRKQIMIEAAAGRIYSVVVHIAYGTAYNEQEALQMLLKNKKEYTNILEASIKPHFKILGVLLNKSVRLTLLLFPPVRNVAKWRRKFSSR
ncbi:MAG TPA: glycosyltransferase, partial [Methanocorpusculum sp.]|nr:glycosyltransferase [Methanocorpusculum sp.]